MHAALHVLTQTSIDEGGFKEPASWILAFLASLVALCVALRISGRYRHEDVRTTRDTVLDVIVLLSAGSVVASLSTTPFLTSLTASIYRRLQAWMDSSMNFGSSIVLGGGILLILIVLALGLFYINTRSGWWLFLFGLGLQVAAIYADWINTALSWWVNNPVQWLWNLVIGAIMFFPNIRINF